MNTYSGMAMATQRQAEDRSQARRHSLALEATPPRKGSSFRQLLRLRPAPLPGAVRAPQGPVSSWRLSP
jgi:hypothetical protein